MKLELASLVFIIVFHVSCGQSENKIINYNESNFTEIKRGTVDGYPYVIKLVHKLDTNYTLKKFFLIDSTYTSGSYVKVFYYKNIANGPYARYSNGAVVEKGFYNNGMQDGERLRYDKGSLKSKSYFKGVEKTGTWYEYDKNGKVVKETIFKDDKLISIKQY